MDELEGMIGRDEKDRCLMLRYRHCIGRHCIC